MSMPGTNSTASPKQRKILALSSMLSVVRVIFILVSVRSQPGAIAEPLTQIVAGVGLLLTGVLNLVGNLLSGLGLDSLLKGIVSATVSPRWRGPAHLKSNNGDVYRVSTRFTRVLVSISGSMLARSKWILYEHLNRCNEGHSRTLGCIVYC